MKRSRITAAAAGAVIAAGASGLAGCSSGPSYPHAWCGPLVAQLHAKTRDPGTYAAGLARVQQQGAPAGQLIRDENASLRNQAAADGTATQPGDVGAIQAAPILIGRVTADLKHLNAMCGQPADAWKADDA